jgi:hypothetical protein
VRLRFVLEVDDTDAVSASSRRGESNSLECKYEAVDCGCCSGGVPGTLAVALFCVVDEVIRGTSSSGIGLSRKRRSIADCAPHAPGMRAL